MSKFKVLAKKRVDGSTYDIEWNDNRLLFFEKYEGVTKNNECIVVRHKKTGGYTIRFYGLPPQSGDIIHLFAADYTDSRDLKIVEMVNDTTLKLCWRLY